MSRFDYEEMMDRTIASSRREQDDRAEEEARIAQEADDAVAEAVANADFDAWLAAEQADIKRDEDAFELHAETYAALGRYFAANPPARRYMKEAA